jgi:hypothetical protein
MKKMLVLTAFAPVFSLTSFVSSPVDQYSATYSETKTYIISDPCSGEDVNLTKTIDFYVHKLFNGKSELVFYHNSIKYNGIGLTSGKSYTGSIEFTNSFNCTNQGATSFTMRDAGIITTPGGGNNLVFDEQEVAVLNADPAGLLQVKLTITSESFTCQ